MKKLLIATFFILFSIFTPSLSFAEKILWEGSLFCEEISELRSEVNQFAEKFEFYDSEFDL